MPWVSLEQLGVLVIPSLVLVGWIVTRFAAHFFLTAEEDARMFWNRALWGTTAAAASREFFKCCIEPFHASEGKHLHVRIHLVISSLLAVFMVLQLTPAVRTSNYARHRLVGYLSTWLTVAFLAHSAYMTFVLPTPLAMPSVVVVMDECAFFVLASSYAGALFAVSNGQVAVHRSLMMFAAASLMLNPSQRFFWVLTTRFYARLEGPFESYSDWADFPTTMSVVLAAFLNYGVAAFYSVFVEANSRDLLRRGVFVNKKVT